MQHPFYLVLQWTRLQNTKLQSACHRKGGIGIIHKNNNAEEQVSQVNVVKRSESSMISDPNYR